MGCGWGYGNYRTEKKREGPVFIFLISQFFFDCVVPFYFSGGILGWDPVRTTCIPCEMMMRL